LNRQPFAYESTHSPGCRLIKYWWLSTYRHVSNTISN